MQSAQNLSIIVALGGGLLSFLSPCVLPLVPSYISYIAGVTFDDLRDPDLSRHYRKKVVLNSLFFVLGFSTVFIFLGASFSFLGRFFASHQQVIQRMAGLIIIFFGFYIAGAFKIPFLMRSKEFIPLKTKPTGYMGSTIIGISFGSAWTPCIGPILGSILALAGSANEMRGGVILLTAYSMGFAIPFLLTAWAGGTLLNLSQRFGKLLHVIQIAGGIFLILIGILIFSGYFKVLNSLFIGLTPAWLLEKI
ncbi:MAG: cytochrome c biogenesis CcdA family protein [bacterium]